MVAVQVKDTGVLVNIYEDLDSVKNYLSKNPDLEVIEITDKTNKFEVRYVELGGPSGYGCDCPEFTTYNNDEYLCIMHLAKWMQDSCHVFGPDPREIRHYLENCRVSYNGEDVQDWFGKQINGLLKNYKIIL